VSLIQGSLLHRTEAVSVELVMLFNNTRVFDWHRASSGEKYEKSNVRHGDYVFYKFTQKIGNNPNQIVRYVLFYSLVIISDVNITAWWIYHTYGLQSCNLPWFICWLRYYI